VVVLSAAGATANVHPGKPSTEPAYPGPVTIYCTLRIGAGAGNDMAIDEPQPSEQVASQPRALVRRALWWCSYVSAWWIVLALVAAVALRIFAFDATYVLVWLNAFTRYIYLPAYACAAWALWQRRWLLLSGSLFVIACHLTWMAPDFVRDRRSNSPRTAMTGTSPRLRVFFANVMGTNKEQSSLLAEIAAANPDVIVLVEFSWPWHIGFTKAQVMKPYQYGTGWMQSNVGSVCLFSKLPLKMEQQDWIEGRAVHTADIQLGAQTLRLIGLHAPRPTGRPQPDYFAYWNQALPKLLAE
jgi:endonuclease/exonuclease/phosphatase (EEP) superfamily protein YafD